VYLTNKEIALLIRAICEYEESVMNMNDFEKNSQAESYGYSESALDKISFKLIKQKRKNNARNTNAQKN